MAMSGGGEGGRYHSTAGTIGCPGGTQEGLHKASTASSALREFRFYPNEMQCYPVGPSPGGS